MKELSIKQKAKAYDEAKARMSIAYNSNRCTIGFMNEIFPELKESEGERIRKWIIDDIKYNMNNKPLSSSKYKKQAEKAIAWLEKQGDKPQGKTAFETIKKEKVDNQNCVKSVYNDEPKFKVGDWVVFDNGNVEHIISVGTHGYTFDDGDYLLHDKCDKIAHLWSIADAKNGDVLTWDDTSCVVLFKNIKNSKCFISYCFANDISFEIGTSHCIKGCHPATKKQRDLLFDKMKEVGYEWDAEKKKLKNIDSEITIPFGAKDSELQEATYYIPKGFYAEIDDDKIVIKKGEKPTAWSKKDEKMFEYALNMIEWYSGKNEDKSRFVSDWLKSIKQRIGG